MKGLRPERPDEAFKLGLSDSIWELMQACWQTDSDKRPGISLVLQFLRKTAPEVSRPELLELSGFDATSLACMNVLRSVLDSPFDLDLLPSESSYSISLKSLMSFRRQLVRHIQVWFLIEKAFMYCRSYGTESVAFLLAIYFPSVPEAAKVNHSALNGLYICLLLLYKMFLYEVIIWKRLSHPNILPFIGLSDQSFPLCVVSPWTAHGNTFLRIRKQINFNWFVWIYACCMWLIC